jgi:hypothetical protein
MTKEVLRLAGLLACVALAASRIGLLLHELVAHGGVALACGARIVDVQVYWFAGGWIRYVLPAPSLAATLAISMSGIAIELVAGGAVWLLVRRESLGGRLVRGIGAALVLHATWYLATGAFHGFGDGLVLYRQLGDARVPVAVAAGLATCATAFVGTRDFLAPLVRVLPGTRRGRVAGLVIAVVLGGGVHAALTLGELRLRRDATYVEVMQTEADRTIARELAQWQHEQARRGIAPTPQARRQQRTLLAREHEPFPFVPLLAIATLLSVLAGALRVRPGNDERISSTLLFRAAIAAFASTWSVIVIDGLVR